MITAPPANLFATALDCLYERDPSCKVTRTLEAAAQWRAGCLTVTGKTPPLQELAEPGRPEHPRLVPPRALTKRSAKGIKGRMALIHAVAHIEFNAINLAWDAVYRFRNLPEAFYADWIQVAEEEARHFLLLQDRLQTLGGHYGDFPAHDGLWTLARRTAQDPLIRMALIPRVMEAHGLDVTPGMIARLQAAGDADTAAALRLILSEEIGHVAAGSRWFGYLCRQRNLEPASTYFALIAEYRVGGGLRCPLNLPDRRRAGFTEAELERLQALCISQEAARSRPRE